MYEPTSNSDSDGLGAVACTEFFHDVLNMSLYCFLRDEKERCDIAVSISCSHLLKDFNLSFAQGFSSKMLHQLSCDPRSGCVSALHTPCGSHLRAVFAHALEHVALRSRLQSALNLGVSFKRRKHDHTGIRGTLCEWRAMHRCPPYPASGHPSMSRRADVHEIPEWHRVQMMPLQPIACRVHFGWTVAMPSLIRGWSSTQKTRILDSALIYVLAFLCHAPTSRVFLGWANGTIAI